MWFVKYEYQKATTTKRAITAIHAMQDAQNVEQAQHCTTRIRIRLKKRLVSNMSDYDLWLLRGAEAQIEPDA